MKPIRVTIVDIVGNINIIPRTVNTHPIPCMLNSTVCTCIAVDDVARDSLASADGGEETGDIITDARFSPQGFTGIRILIKTIVIVVVGDVLGHPSICRHHLFFVGITRGNFIVKK